MVLGIQEWQARRSAIRRFVIGLTFQAFDSNLQFVSEACRTGCGVRIASARVYAVKFGQAAAGKFRCAGRVLSAALVMDGELFASQNAVLGIASEFEPECGCGGVVASTLGKQGKLAASARAELGGKAEIKRLCASDVGAIGIAATLKESREAEEIEAVYSIAIRFLGGEKCVDLAKERGEAT